MFDLIFFWVAETIRCNFCFPVNIFTSKISNMLINSKCQSGQGLWIFIHLQLRTEYLKTFKSNKQRWFTNPVTPFILMKLLKRILRIGLKSCWKICSWRNVLMTQYDVNVISYISLFLVNLRGNWKAKNKWLSSFMHWGNKVIIYINMCQ